MDVEIEKLAGDLDIEVVSGSTDIELPEDAAFEFEAHVSSGHVDTSFDVTDVLQPIPLQASAPIQAGNRHQDHGHTLLTICNWLRGSALVQNTISLGVALW